MKEVRVDIRPGSMITDKVSNELGEFHHQTVKNLRQLKAGQWRAVSPYANLKTGLADVKAAIEVTEDRTSERFLLFQSGISLYRLDYSSGYSGSPTLLTLPTGVTIGASATLRFFYHNGVVRITGGSKPMWYGYIQELLFLGNVLGDEVDVDEWHLTTTELTNTLEVDMDNTDLYLDNASGSDDRYIFAKLFYVYDDAQYSLMTDFESIDPAPTSSSQKTGLASEIGVTNDGVEFVAFDLIVSGTDLKTEFSDRRITAIGVATAITSVIQVDEAALDWRVSIIVPINETIEAKRWSHASLAYDGATGDELQIDTEKNMLYDGFIAVGDQITLRNKNGSVTTTAASIATGGAVTFDDSILDLVTSVGVPEDPIPVTAIELSKAWAYDSAVGYTIRVGVEVGTGNTFSEFTGNPDNAPANYPDYRHHIVINGIAYIDPQSVGSEDFVGYSLLNQLDNFAASNIFGTEVGDTDRIAAIVERDGRLVIFKKNSGSQGNWSGSSFFKDVGFIKRGLHSEFGFIAIDNIIYWIGSNDVYAYGGGPQPMGLLSNHGLRQYYLDNVSTTTRIHYNKQTDEILIDFGATMLVYHAERKSWYLRVLDVEPVCSIIDFDQRLLIFSATKLIDMNAVSGTDEIVTWQVVMRVIDDKQRDNFKKLIEFHIAAKGDSDIDVTWRDAVENTFGVGEITPSTTIVKNKELRSRFLHKQLELQLDGVGDVTIEEMYALIGVWK